MVYFLLPIVGIATVPVGGYGLLKLSNVCSNVSYKLLKGSLTDGAPYPFPPQYLSFRGEHEKVSPTKATPIGSAFWGLVFLSAFVAGRKRNPAVKWARNINLGPKSEGGEMRTFGHFFATNAPGILGLCMNMTCSVVAAGLVRPIFDKDA